jgi:hypothetical protein
MNATLADALRRALCLVAESERLSPVAARRGTARLVAGALSDAREAGQSESEARRDRRRASRGRRRLGGPSGALRRGGRPHAPRYAVARGRRLRGPA